MSRARSWTARVWCSSFKVCQGWVSSRRRSKRFGFFSCKFALLGGRGSTDLAGCGSEAAEESIYHGPCMKQVLERAECCCCWFRGELCRQGQIGPIGRDQRLTAIGRDQNKMQSTLTMRPLHNVQGSAIERMASTDNGDLLRKVLLMGSVSWLRSTRCDIISCWKRWHGGSMTKWFCGS